MRVIKSSYKDLEALKLQYGDCEVIILPSEGGKMASFRSKGKEYLAQREGGKYKPLTLDGNYVDSECSGFDDMFPTIDPCFNGQRMYLGHGEVCRVPASYEIHEKGLFMHVESPFNDYVFTKDYTLDDLGRLTISYSTTNLQDEPLMALWAAHLMLKAEDGQNILIPKGVYPSQMMFSSKDAKKGV